MEIKLVFAKLFEKCLRYIYGECYIISRRDAGMLMRLKERREKPKENGK